MSLWKLVGTSLADTSKVQDSANNRGRQRGQSRHSSRSLAGVSGNVQWSCVSRSSVRFRQRLDQGTFEGEGESGKFYGRVSRKGKTKIGWRCSTDDPSNI